MEARAALTRPGITNLAANQSPLKLDTAPVPPISGSAPTSIPSGSLYLFIYLFIFFPLYIRYSVFVLLLKEYFALSDNPSKFDCIYCYVKFHLVCHFTVRGEKDTWV